ncbi:MAG: hypothetical protein CMLOHMNK_03183 [Steroidobacteraceae bacterium]|nr:hypothetical protein [Steroidobacteraceae bacterium]
MTICGRPVAASPPALEAAQEALLRLAEILVAVERADGPLGAPLAVRDEAQFLHKRAVAVGAHRGGHRARIVVIEREKAGLRVEARVLAHAVAGVVVVGGARGERREAEVDVRLERRDLDIARGGFELDRAVLVAAVAAAIAVEAARFLPAPADLVALRRVRQREVDLVGRVPGERGAPVPDFDRVGVLLHVILGVVAQHPVRRDRNAVGIEPVEIHVIGESRVVEPRAGDAQRRGFAERNVDDSVDAVADIVRAVHFRAGGGDAAGELAGLRGARDVAHGAAEGARAVQRALRTAQHFDPLDVLQQEVRVDGRLVEIGRHRRDGRELVVAIGGTVRVHAADHDAVDDAGVAVTAIDDRDAWHGAHQVSVIEDLPAFEDISGDRRDVVGHIDHRFGAPRRRDDDLLERRRSTLRGRLLRAQLRGRHAGEHGGHGRGDRRATGSGTKSGNRHGRCSPC